MNNDAGYWAEVEALFHALSDVSEENRVSRLNEMCAGRDELRAEVESLLESNRRLASFMNPSAESGENGFLPTLGPGDRVGTFRLVEEIGSGGMATVYRGERADGEFEHRVAIKLMSAPLAGTEANRRFKLERQILASLRHPNVVTLLDGGVASDGRGYLAMEFVEGVPLTTYSESQSLSLEERLVLFREVCSGVHYAHRHGVVHRDLKPANILITEEGKPKVLDFGIAMLTGGGYRHRCEAPDDRPGRRTDDSRLCQSGATPWPPGDHVLGHLLAGRRAL